jgi:flagellar basal body-associated protein FliL
MSNAAAAAEAPVAPKGKKKLIIIVAAAVLLLGGGGGAAVMLLKKKPVDDEDGEATAQVEKAKPKASRARATPRRCRSSRRWTPSPSTSPTARWSAMRRWH